MPLIGDFLVRMRDSHQWLVSQNRSLEADSVQEVLQFRLNAASAAYWTQLDLENIEELFSLAASNSDALTEHIQRAIAATLDYCANVEVSPKIRLRIERKPWIHTAPWLKSSSAGADYFEGSTYAHHVARLLGMLRDGKTVGKNTFITFNYDTVLEDALEALAVPYAYGFKKQTVNWHSSMRADRNLAVETRVLKLHGSVNWGRKGKMGRSFTVYGRYSDLLKNGILPELVPPTWRKVFQDQLADIWDVAVETLQSATRVVIIGFSIPPTDTHFKYLLAAGLQKNVSLRRIHFCGKDDSLPELKSRASVLLRNSYIDRGLISFSGEGLHEMCTRSSVLGDLGRSSWKTGDDGSIQIS